MPLGALISAGANLLGGAMSSAATREANQASRQLAYDNINLQKDFATSGIRWKVEDAKRAGIHPIYALGASTPSFSPVSANFAADNSMGNAMAAAGQDIGRAINATRPQDERMTVYNKTAQALQLENMSLQNDVLRTEIASKNARLQQTLNPPMASATNNFLIPGQTGSPLVSDQPMNRVYADPSRVHQEPGATTDTGHLRTSGGLFPVPSKDAKEKIEDNWYQETAHFVRNNLLPMISPVFNEPPHAPEKGKAWVYDPIYGYKQVPDRWLNRFLRYHARD